MNSKLLFKVIKRIEYMGSIEVFVIFMVRALNLTVVPGCIGLYELVLYAALFKTRLKQCRRRIFGIF